MHGGCGKPSQKEVVVVAHVVVEVVATDHAWRLWEDYPSRAHRIWRKEENDLKKNTWTIAESSCYREEG